MLKTRVASCPFHSVCNPGVDCVSVLGSIFQSGELAVHVVFKIFFLKTESVFKELGSVGC